MTYTHRTNRVKSHELSLQNQNRVSWDIENLFVNKYKTIYTLAIYSFKFEIQT